MGLRFLTIDVNPKSTMIHSIYSSPITSPKTVFISDETGSVTESDSSVVEWTGPENQLGLEPEYLFGLEQDDPVEDNRGKVEQDKVTEKY